MTVPATTRHELRGAAAADPLPMLVGGQWRAGTGVRIESIDPADGEPIAEVTGASAADVAEAVVAASEAMAEPGWADALPHERADLLHAVSDGIRARSEDLAVLQSRDNGKPIAEARALVASAAGTFRFFAAATETAHDDVTPARGAYLSLSTHQPIGVVGAITPWNSPIASEAQKVAPALAAGCAVLLKPSELSPLLALELGRICEAAGVPPGIVSVLPGPGHETGAAVVEHPLVAKVSFTGGTGTGRAIAGSAARKLMPVSLELGGKSPTIVFEDADLDLAAAGVVHGIFASAGQACVAGSRLFVARPLFEPFVARLIGLAQRLTVGHPRHPSTRVGPLISAQQRDRVASYVALARDEGGDVRCGGRAPDDPALATGYYYLPTVITGLDNRARTCREEIFGPVLCALPFDTEDEVIAAANDSEYGLACGVWTGDYRRALRLARRIDTGTVWVNTYKALSVASPFGGEKDSGTGREKGRDGIRAYQRQTSVFLGLSTDPNPWATATVND